MKTVYTSVLLLAVTFACSLDHKHSQVIQPCEKNMPNE